MLKSEFHRVETFKDGEERIGLITLKRVPKAGTIKIIKDDEEIVPTSFSAIGMPILSGETLEYYFQNSEFNGPELLVEYEEEEPDWQICTTESEVKEFLKEHSLKTLAINVKKHVHNKDGIYWVPNGKELVIWDKYVLVPNGEFLHLEEVENFSDTFTDEVKDFEFWKKEYKRMRCIQLESSLRNYECPICGKGFSIKEILEWDFELTKEGPIHSKCKR